MPKGKKKVVVEELTPATLATVINKRFGAGTMKMASDPSLRIQRIPTGILSVDWLMGGGFPLNRYVEIYGTSNVGKSAICMKLCAHAQEMGLQTAWIDAEKSFDPVFAAHLGVDIDTLAYHEQINANRVVDFAETLLRSRLYGVVVLDSIASLAPLQELESDMEATSYGMEQAKLMSKALRKLTVANQNTAMAFINQTREAIGVTFGKKTTTSGGRAMGFYAGMRLEVVRTEAVKRPGKKINDKGDSVAGDLVIGHRMLIRTEKDKTGGSRPAEQVTTVFNYEKSDFDHLEDLIYLGRVTGLVHKQGDKASKWWVEGYEDERLSGRPAFKRWLRHNVAVAEELEESIRDQISSQLEEDSEEPDEAEEE